MQGLEQDTSVQSAVSPLPHYLLADSDERIRIKNRPDRLCQDVLLYDSADRVRGCVQEPAKHAS